MRIILDNNLKQTISKVQIVSFDIFDTLLLRPFIQPSDVFAYISKYTDKPHFLDNRIKAEKQAKILKLARDKKQDCTIDDIYALMPDFQALKDVEIDFEKSIAVANKETLEILNYAKSIGKKIFLISDMYLSANIIKDMLRKANIDGYDEIFVSSEIGKSKAGKDLYKYILDKYQINPTNLLHIGDNPVSDVEIPKKLGIQTHYYKPPVLDFFENSNNAGLRSFYTKNKQNPILSLILGLRIINSLNNNQDYWFNFGFNYAAPLSVSTTLNAIDTANKENLSDLFFISRDEYFPNEIYPILKGNCQAKNHYVYINRVLRYKYGDCNNNDSNEYTKYLNSIETKGNKIGIVDSAAGTFSAQYILERFMPSKEFLGIYLHTKENDNYRYINLSGKNVEEVDKMFGLSLIDFLLTSLEPKIEDIKNCKPIYETNENKYEIIKRDIFKKILEGEKEFVTQYQRLFSKYPLVFNVRLIYEYIESFWKSMSDADKQFLSQIKCPVDTQQIYYVSIVDTNKDKAAILREALKKKLALKNKIKTNPQT